MKKLIAILLTAAMLLSALPTAVFADGGFGLKADSDGTAVTLSWEKVPGAGSYTVYYNRSGAKPKSLGSFKSLKLKVNGLKSGVSYSFKVVSDNGFETDDLSITPETGKKKSVEKYPEKEEFETGKEAAEEFGAGYNIGNAFDSIDSSKPTMMNEPLDRLETAWGNPVINEDYIKGIKKAGFGAVRLPVTWGKAADSEGNVRKDYLDRIQEVVDMILEEDMYCIINVHHDTGSDGWIRASDSSFGKYGDRFGKIWEQVAEKFKDYGEKLLFECMNETLNDNGEWYTDKKADFDAIKKWQKVFVDTVRASGGNNEQRNLILSTYAASSSSGIINAFELPSKVEPEHIVLEVHNYDPQGFSWRDVGYDTERSSWGTSQDKKQVDDFLYTLSKKADSLGVGAIVGEFGSVDKSNESERAKQAEYMYKNAHKYGVAVFWWDNGSANDFRIFDRTNGKATMPKIVKAIVNAVDD